MKLLEVFEVYELISKGSENFSSRKKTMQLRKVAINITIENKLTKIAFDTRRINQNIQYNPRRGLQNYNRSEAFISEALGQKLKNFAKLRDVLSTLNKEYGEQHEWQDSNARVLLATLNNGLRSEFKDGDFSSSQPAQGSLDYIEELLHVRYRLGFDELTKLSDIELKKIILSKDEELINKDVNKALNITKSDVGTHTYDSLIEKLFASVKATKENPEVERTITITIKDKFGA